VKTKREANLFEGNIYISGRALVPL